MKKSSRIQKIRKWVWQYPVFMAFFSLFGMVASAILSIEKEHLLKNPDAELLCSINPVYSCQNVILSDQSSVFGFSNELIGIAFFGGMLALALGMLAGAKYAKWLHGAAWFGLLGSMGMVVWFFYQSVYNINALCIYCSTVWFATWTLFVGYTRWLITSKTFIVPKKYKKLAGVFVAYAPSVWFGLIAIFAALILNHFWYYYGTYFS